MCQCALACACACYTLFIVGMRFRLENNSDETSSATENKDSALASGNFVDVKLICELHGLYKSCSSAISEAPNPARPEWRHPAGTGTRGPQDRPCCIFSLLQISLTSSAPQFTSLMQSIKVQQAGCKTGHVASFFCCKFLLHRRVQSIELQ